MLYNEQALRYFPTDARLHYGRGLIYHTAGKLDSALVAYQETIKLQPTYYQAYFQTGLIQQKFRNYYGALTNYQRVLQLRPQFPRIDTYVGYCHEQLGQYDLALAAYTKATKQNGADRQAVAGLWRSQHRQYAQNSYNSLFLPDEAAEPLTPARTRAVLDTTRVRISTIQPRVRETNSSGDTLRRTIKPIGQN